VALYCLKTKEE